MTTGTAVLGAARIGSAIFGSTGVDDDIVEPEPAPDLDWDADADTPEDPPDDEPTVPELIFELIERNGTHVRWLDKSFGRKWRRDRNRPGSATVAVKRGTATANDLVAPRMLRARYRGKVVQDALIRPRSDRAVDDAEEVAHVLTITGPGRLAVLDEGVVGPWSETARPPSDSQRFNPFHPDFELTDDWIAAEELARQDDETEHWTGLPANWPGSGAEKWIGAPGDTTDDTTYTASVDYWGRRKITLPYARYAACWTADDASELHINGVRQGETRTFHGFERVDIRLAGETTFGVKFSNIEQIPTNPIGFLFSLMPIEAGTGRLGDPVLVSDSSWRILPNPAEEPGWKLGRIVRYVLQRFHARGGPPIFRSFTDDLDADGNDWPTLTDFTVAANATLTQFLQQIIETYADAFMTPGTHYPKLYLWNKGGRGVDLTTRFGSGHEAVTTPCVTALTVDTEPPYATSILARWADGWIRRARAVAGWFVERTIEFPNVLTRSEAVAKVDELLDIYSQPRTQYTLEVKPRTTAQHPHITGGFDEADRIKVVLDGTDHLVPVESVEGTLTDGAVLVTIEAGDLLLDREDRLMAKIRAMEAGSFGGRSAQPTSTKIEPARQQVATIKRPLRFHRPAEVTTVLGDGDTPEETGRIGAWVATLPGGAEGSDVTVNLYVNGAPSGVSVTIPAGSIAKRTRCNVPVHQDVDLVQPRCTSTGFALVAKAIFE